MKEKLIAKYQYIFEENLIKEMALVGQIRKVKKGNTMIDIGNNITHIPLILDGAISVINEDKDQNEYLLYYLEIGDSCAMTMSCCLGGKKSEIRALVEKDAEVVMFPVSKMEDWLIKYRSWRIFVFQNYEAVMSEMLEAIDTLAFHNMEERLYKYIRDKVLVLETSTLEITHHQIAKDLSTSRVVISRLIKKLALDHKIKSTRNSITLLK